MSIAPHYRIYACFFLFALTTGALLARLPDLQVNLGVTESQLGLTLIGMSMGSLISLTLSAPLIARLGARTTAFITILGPALIFSIIPWLPTTPAVFLALFCTGLLSGALEINLNIETDRLEAQYGKRFMNRAHGFWSVGFFVTALAAAGIRQSGLSMHWHLGMIAVLVFILGGFMISGMTSAPLRPDSHQGDTPRIAFPNLGLLPLCVIGIAAFLVEGAGIDWAAIYMRDVFDVVPFIGGLSLTLFAFFMATTRLLIDPVVERFGPRTVAMSLLGIAAIGLLLVGYAPNATLALIGFSLMGVGCSAVYPIAVSAAAQRTDRPSAVNVAALGQVTFVIFFLAPPLLGFVAQYLGIRNSFLICLPVLAIGLLASRALPRRNQTLPARLIPQPGTPHG